MLIISKNHIFGRKIFKQATKITVGLKMLKLLENHVKTKCLKGIFNFFFFLLKALFFESFDQKSIKSHFCQKNQFVTFLPG